MNEFEDTVLRASLAGFATAHDDSDWGDVVRRAERSHRHRVVGGVAIAAVVLVGVASAFALTRPTVDFFAAKKGPNTVVNDFGSMQVRALPGMAPGVLPHETRRIAAVEIDGKNHILYVAPTKAGGFCYQWSNLTGSCRASRTGPTAKRIGGGGFGGPNGMTVLNGTFQLAAGERLEVSYADGVKSQIPFVWVTKPIEAGFYLFRVPDAHRRAGHQAVSVALFDNDGRLLSRQKLPSGDGMPFVGHKEPGFGTLVVPAEAVYAKRQQLFDLRADNGARIGLWIAPQEGGGTCFWTNRSSGCDQGRSPKLEPSFLKAHPELKNAEAILGFGFRSGPGVVMCCRVSENVARVELRFQDGDRIELIPKMTFLITAIPSRHYELGHRVNRIVAYDATGKVIAERAVGDWPGVYPCAKAEKVNLGYGVSRCP